ncbi:MAG TPA: glycosyl hydrolase family 65 protein [Armatimonadota bacterium]|jgi:kojibiose phosphorylase
MPDQSFSISRTEATPSALEGAASVFTISNGYLALKGALLEDRRGRRPTTLVAGVFDRADMIRSIPPSAHERRYLDESRFDDAAPMPSVANLPDPLFTLVLLNGEELAFRRGEARDFEQTWDLRRGLYQYKYTFVDGAGRETRVEMARFASMPHPHRAHLRYRITPLNYTANVDVRAGIDGTVRSNLHGDRQFDVEALSASDNGRCHLRARTLARKIEVDIAAHTRFTENGPEWSQAVLEDGRAYHQSTARLKAGETLEFTRAIVIATSEDARRGAAVDLEAEITAAAADGFDDGTDANAAWWAETWPRVDVQIEGDPRAQAWLRFCIFQLVAAAPRHTDQLSAPCKLLTGEWYQGSVFYDTDLYIVPFYTFTLPRVARACLNYRWRGLAEGREIARRLGLPGAKFAWQSGPDGEEVLGSWFRFVHTNIHINSDVAYALMQYVHATGDQGFLRDKGADILIECARFYSARARRDERGAYHLDDVSGPDEGHCESTDNYYTNFLARKTLLWAVSALEAAPNAAARLGVSPDEPAKWRQAADGLAFRYDPDTKVYEQYEGYYGLKPIPPGFRDEQREWWFTVFPYQAIHQPDVVMAQTLFREETPPDVFAANDAFYRERSMDFSSMSHVIHSIAAKETGNMERAYRQFMITAGEDIDESLTGRGDTADGLHGTATGGAWMAAVLGFGGIHLRGSTLLVNPRLPAHWTSLRFRIQVHGETLAFAVTQDSVTIMLGRGADAEIDAEVCGEPVTLKSGEIRKFPLPAAP